MSTVNYQQYQYCVKQYKAVLQFRLISQYREATKCFNVFQASHLTQKIPESSNSDVIIRCVIFTTVKVFTGFYVTPLTIPNIIKSYFKINVTCLKYQPS